MSSINFTSDSLVGLTPGPGLDLYNVSLAAAMPSSFGMLVYRLETSSVAKMQLGGNFPMLSKICKKCVVSYTNDLSFCVGGFRK